MKARHVMILASAGSGKTYALTTRFVRLLAEGAAPERIVALTFTRKAAGEFFDEILNKLARAAREDVFAAQLARDIGQPALGPVEFRRMLRAVVDAMHRLRLGTFDGFFARITRTFPFELGLTGEFEVLQEHAGRIERRRVLQRMFARMPGGLEAAQKEFIEAFKRATFGAEEKRLGMRLDAFLDDHQETFLAAPDGKLWGNAERIWPEGCGWLDRGKKPLAEAAAALHGLLARRSLPEKQLARWTTCFAALPECLPGAPLPGPVEYILKNALAVWADIRRGSAEMTVERKKLTLSREECAELATLVKHLVAAELTRKLETTRGIHAVLQGYEAVYHDAVRRGGKLTFGDVLRLLLPDATGRVLAHGNGEAAAEEMARAEAAETKRMAIDFRLDAQFDHWLLDEFQDTSFGQWSVLRNLIDEAVQDPAGVRSFFCVGDVKQAIYTWREGDPRLFREIFEHYNHAAPGTIAEQHLVASWRSGPAIIEMVNAVFGGGHAIAELFPGVASRTWNREWRAHETARPALGGQAAWLYADDERERFALTARIVREIAPLERGLACAVLTQTNEAATRLADYLRREANVPAVADSDLHVCTDNPLGAALLALVQAAAHPGDTLAQEHWRMTPLRAALEEEGIARPEQLTQRILAQIHADGFERTIEFWLRRAERALAADDDFSRERGRQFVAAAALFDATGSRDVAEFAAFMQRHVVRDAEAAGVVRVMTIHKSKGLGFDVVVLPDLEGQRLDQRRGGLAVQRTPERRIDWVLELPAKLFYAEDEMLSAHVRAAEAEACYEALSLLYVAMTRAKRAMYLVTKPPGNSESRNYPRLLASTLGAETRTVRVGSQACAGAWSAGDATWFEGVTAAVARKEPPAPEPDLDPRTMARASRRASRRPSGSKAGVVPAAQVFALEGGAATEFGSAVHTLLSQVEWLDDREAERHATAWREHEDRNAAVQALACLRAEALAHVWQRPRQGEVWRERSFEIVLNGEWVTGAFDRVVIERNATTGRATRVTVFDFKSDVVEDAADVAAGVARHAAQLNVYRRVAAVLTGLPAATVRCELVFTRVQCAIVVPES